MFVFTGGEALFAFLYENYPSLNLTIVTNISIYILYFTSNINAFYIYVIKLDF